MASDNPTILMGYFMVIFMGEYFSFREGIIFWFFSYFRVIFRFGFSCICRGRIRNIHRSIYITISLVKVHHCSKTRKTPKEEDFANIIRLQGELLPAIKGVICYDSYISKVFSLQLPIYFRQFIQVSNSVLKTGSGAKSCTSLVSQNLGSTKWTIGVPK